MHSIYIIDDDADQRLSLYHNLSPRQDLSVACFESGRAFLDAMAGLAAGVLLLDMNMPGVTGLDVLRAISSDARFLAIVITGEGDMRLAVSAMKAGAVDFISKPYDFEELEPVIDRTLERLASEHSTASYAAAAMEKLEQLSPRELDVLTGLIDGKPNKVIAQELNISPRTVESYRAQLMVKLGVRSLGEALRIAYAAGLFARR